MTETKKAPDWERIELDYRAGLLSIREIASQHGITHGAVNKRAKRDGWDRDLTAKIKAKADNLVSKREVSALVSAEKVATERAVVEANAEVIANVRLAHRQDISRARNLAMRLLSEIEAVTDDNSIFHELGEMLRSEDDKGQDKRNDLYNRVIEMPSRIDGMKKLSETLKTLIGLERESYDIVTVTRTELTGENGAPIQQVTSVVNKEDVKKAMEQLESDY